ncbi:hypothetical protein HOT45_gp33 [Gordonia phage Trine]|uniref:Uncharacterized protein n=1 Tax=Gordonia phage Trine TaxID=2201431 RepID=A0A2Z4Q9H2_9CAUD|nr:hypothetical protein HOT45_gp33 [Gordonia phage Trine]AWY06535.1 hypothetical protein PBI_TRINE_33 [Gordonia phage Trine]
MTGQDPRHDRDWVVGVALCWVGVLLATAYLLAQILRWIF